MNRFLPLLAVVAALLTLIAVWAVGDRIATEFDDYRKTQLRGRTDRLLDRSDLVFRRKGNTERGK